MNRVRFLLTIFVLSALLTACSLPPNVPLTRDQLMKTRIYNHYIIEESPEQVLNALNKQGEVILEAKRNIRGKNYPVYLKLLAAGGGIEVVDYDR